MAGKCARHVTILQMPIQKAETVLVVDLPKEGITGNDHFMFQDLNNDVIQEHIENWIRKCRSISSERTKMKAKK